MNRVLKAFCLLCAAWALSVSALLISAQAVSAADKPNIVFVMIDDLGAEAVGCYGGESYKTPNMDALAERGMMFNERSPAWLDGERQSSDS